MSELDATFTSYLSCHPGNRFIPTRQPSPTVPPHPSQLRFYLTLATSLLRHTHPNLTSIRRLLQPTGRRIATKFGDGLPGFSRDSRPFHPVCLPFGARRSEACLSGHRTATVNLVLSFNAIGPLGPGLGRAESKSLATNCRPRQP